MRCRQTSAQQTVYGLEIMMQRLARPGSNGPTYAPPRHEIRLREPIKRNDGHVLSERRDGDVLLLRIVDQLVVNFIGENEQVASARQLQHLFQSAPRHHGARWIAGI